MSESEIRISIILTVLIMLLFFGVIIANSKANVEVNICEVNDLTTYVSKNAPPKAVKFGNCRIEVMSNDEYHKLRYAMKQSR